MIDYELIIVSIMAISVDRIHHYFNSLKHHADIHTQNNMNMDTMFSLCWRKNILLCMHVNWESKWIGKFWIQSNSVWMNEGSVLFFIVSVVWTLELNVVWTLRLNIVWTVELNVAKHSVLTPSQSSVQPSERLTPPGIMGAQLKHPWIPSNITALWNRWA